MNARSKLATAMRSNLLWRWSVVVLLATIVLQLGGWAWISDRLQEARSLAASLSGQMEAPAPQPPGSRAGGGLLDLHGDEVLRLYTPSARASEPPPHVAKKN